MKQQKSADYWGHMDALLDSTILAATLVGSFGAAFLGQKIMLGMLVKAMWMTGRREK